MGLDGVLEALLVKDFAGLVFLGQVDVCRCLYRCRYPQQMIHGMYRV